MSDYPGSGRHHQVPQYGGGGQGYNQAPVYGGGMSSGGYSQNPSYQDNSYGYGAPPPGPPPHMGYSNQQGYEPSYAPPPGPPQHQRQDYAFAGSMGAPTYGGNGGGGYGGPAGGYGGPPGGYGAPPPGPPPSMNYGAPGGQDNYHRSNGGGGGGGYGNSGWQPPSGQGMPSRYEAGSLGSNPTAQHQQYHAYSGPAPYRPPQEDQYYGPQFQGGQGGQARQPYFKYSQCTGKKKALCIGVNYIGTSQELRGCINDAKNVMRFLCERFGYKQDDIVLLSDDARNPRQIPTRENMLAAMRWLVDGAQPNDSLFFHYSGHGGQTKDLNGDEDDGFDEVIYPLDHKVSGHIVDDELHEILVRPLPAGCRLTAIFDSCHSATTMDLPYVYSTDGKIKEPNLLADAGQGLLSAGISYMKGDVGGMLSGVMGLGKKIVNQNSGAAERMKAAKTSAADVVSWSGCKDDQTSADTTIASQATGAMSYAFISALNNNPQQSYMQLLNSIRDELKGRSLSQKPQLSASHPMDCNLLFIC